ncbi:glycosyltransferase family A protein [Bifidobacterium sp. ESL0800]|uniref:glycosyltransferase family 2 protein n=1 Tax=Bifidobacterium sp. ESL0800 TaxID=2983236 RepID=UPI0023F85E3B|nr:glycosyltransferase family A protein [Bifidobacterium sp. ESL0800]WEV75717.1 glycosyltransferase family A protein [Bifidobacterium sp. ESL0800]
MNDTANDVTVVITCFNQAGSIQQSVESACAQTCPPARVIVVDDASDDEETQKTLAVLAHRPALEVVHRARNGGPSAARNTGIKRVSTPLVVVLDGDDCLEPEYIEATRTELMADERVFAASSWMRTFGVLGATVRPSGGEVEKFLCRNAAPATCMFRVSALRRSGGYDESMRKGFEDWDCYLSLFETLAQDERPSRVAMVEKPLIRYRTAPASSNIVSMNSRLELLRYLIGKHRDLYQDHLEGALLGFEKTGMHRLSLFEATVKSNPELIEHCEDVKGFMASPSFGDGGMAAAVRIESKISAKSRAKTGNIADTPEFF